jgi:hypothetical protein
MECVIGLYKTECIGTTVFRAGPYRTIGDAEQAHYAALNREPEPV